MDIITTYTNHLKARRLSASTQKTYLSEFKAFRKFYPNEDLRYISREKIIAYLAWLYDCNCSSSKVNQAINAVKFYKEQVLGHKKQKYYIKRPYQSKYIPPILSQEQMFAVINSPKNLKHRTLLYVMYINGLRKSELINLQLMDVRSKVEEPHIIIRNAKHNTNRFLYVEKDFIERITAYYRKYKPKKYLFEGHIAGEPISATTIARILEKALKSQGITERFRVHDIRHNFATHCILNGTDIYDLSKFLGHKSVRTTEKFYLHLLPSQVKIKRPVEQKQLHHVIHRMRA